MPKKGKSAMEGNGNSPRVQALRTTSLPPAVDGKGMTIQGPVQGPEGEYTLRGSQEPSAGERDAEHRGAEGPIHSSPWALGADGYRLLPQRGSCRHSFIQV